MAGSAQSKKPRAKTRGAGALPRHGNRSIVVAVSLLRVIASLGRSATLTEIASAAGMSAPRAHRYLLGLANTRLVEHSPISGRYDLGSEIVELGVAALGKVDAVRFASEVLAPLAEETGLAALITVWGTNGPTVIRCEQAQLESSMRVREGRNVSLLRSASGRVFLTYLPEATVAPFVARELEAAKSRPKSEPVNAGKSLDTLRAEVRRRGLGRGIGEETSSVAVLAAPVFGANGRLALSIGLISAIGGFDTSYKGEPAKALKRTAIELSRRLGFSGADEI
jgi:DNA-binding IclR family transcriptional regulator